MICIGVMPVLFYVIAKHRKGDVLVGEGGGVTKGQPRVLDRCMRSNLACVVFFD